jgi:PII-like signaling protein
MLPNSATVLSWNLPIIIRIVESGRVIEQLVISYGSFSALD